MRNLPKVWVSVAILKDTICSTMTTTRVVSLNLMAYAKDYPIPISTKIGPTIIKTWTQLFMDVDVVLGMIPILVTTGWDEDIIQGGEEDTPTLTPMVMDMIMSGEDIIKIKDSQDLYSLLSHLDRDTTVVVEVGEVIINKVDITIMVLNSLLDRQGIEVHLDITVHHPQDLMDHVNIIGIMDHHLLLGLDIISHLLPLLLLDASISRAHLPPLDVDMGVDIPLLDIGMDIMDHLLSLLDQDIMEPHLLMEEISDDLPKVLMEEAIEDHPENTGLVLVHPHLDASARSMPTTVLMDLFLWDIKGMVIRQDLGYLVDMTIDRTVMVMGMGMEDDILSSLRRSPPKTQVVGLTDNLLTSKSMIFNRSSY